MAQGGTRPRARWSNRAVALTKVGFAFVAEPAQTTRAIAMTDESKFTIRSYRASDREAVRRLCCQTGFLGEPIDPVYEDRELFADFLTTYYTDHEPESSFVIERDGELFGYLLGSRRPFLNQLYSFQQNIVLGIRSMLRYPRYNDRSRKFVRWVLGNGWREVPAAPRRTAHFHINLLPEARKMSTTRLLMSAYLSYLYRSGEKRVFGQIVTFESRRGEKMFERYGFKVMNRSEITKYKAYIRSRSISAPWLRIWKRPICFRPCLTRRKPMDCAGRAQRRRRFGRRALLTVETTRPDSRPPPELSHHTKTDLPANHAN